MLLKAYLLGYNGALFAGWSYVLAQVALNYVNGGTPDTLYPLIQQALMVSQTAAALEILHALLKLVRSPVFTTFVQVMSRLIVLWGAVEIGSKPVTTGWFFTQMVTAWGLSEIIRYSFYFFGLINKDAIPKALTWLRYSAFMVLYPLGITGEIAALIKALPDIQAKQVLSIALPNKYNFAFNFYYFTWFALLGLYPYGSYVMYSYMLSQRRKILGGGKKEKQQ